MFTSLSFGTLCSLNSCRFYVFCHGFCEFICALVLLCLEYSVSLESLITSSSYNLSACYCGSLIFFSHICGFLPFFRLSAFIYHENYLYEVLDPNASNLSFSVQCLVLYLYVSSHLLQKEASLRRAE